VIRLKPQVKGTILVLLSAAGYGTEAVFAKLAYAQGLDPVTTLFYRFVLAGLVLSPVLCLRRPQPPISRRQHFYMFGIGALLNALVVWAIFTSLRYVSASVAIMCLYLYPAFVSLLAGPVQGERPGYRSFLALVFSLGGVALIAWAPAARVPLLGVTLVFLAALGNAAALLLFKKFLGGIDPMVASAEILVSTALYFVAIACINGVQTDLSPVSWSIVGGLALLSTVIPFNALYAGLNMIEASRASILSTSEPLVTAFLAALFLGERLTAAQGLGAALILGSVFVLSYKNTG
jgi:drug/metabolite transporter (DMT)-like permease